MPRFFLPLAILLTVLYLFLRSTPSARPTNLAVTFSVGLTYFKIEGFTSPFAVVNLKESGSVVHSVVASADGTFTLSHLSEEGLHTFEVYAVDLRGTLTSNLKHQVYLAPGVTTTLTGVVLPPTLLVSTNELAQGQTLTASGYGAPNSSLLLYFANEQNTTLTADSFGFFTGSIHVGYREPGQYLLTALNQLSTGHTSLRATHHLITILPGLSEAPVPSLSPSPATPLLPFFTPSPSPIPPWWLAAFDPNSDRFLSLNELKESLLTWFGFFDTPPGTGCDLNLDGRCDLTDLSILLYHIERQP